MSRGKRNPLTTAVLIGSLGAALWASSFAWKQGREMPGLDFFQFWAGAQVARWESAESFYSSTTSVLAYEKFRQRAARESEQMEAVVAARPSFEFFSTPFLYTAFGAFPGRDYDRDLLAFKAVSLLAFALGVLLLARVSGMRWWTALLLLAFTLTLFQPLKSETRVANVNSIQLLALGGAAWFLKRPERWGGFAGGVLLALVAAFKPNIAAVVPLLIAWRVIVRERMRAVIETAGAAAGAAIAVVAGSLYFGSLSAWREWLDAARALASTSLPLSAGNVAPLLNFPAALEGSNAGIAALVLFPAVLLLLLRKRDTANPVLPIGLGLLIYLLTAPLVWLHYLILALPLAIALIGDPASGVRRALAVVALTFIGADVWRPVLGIRTLAGEAKVLWWGLALIAVLAAWRLLTSPLPPPPRARTPSRT